MTAVRTLTIETAPRDVPGLCQWSSYALLKFAEEIGLTAEPSAAAAFARFGRSERAEHVSAALKAYDAKNGGVPAAAAPPQQVAPPAAPMQPAAPAAPTAPGGAPAPAVTGRKPRNSGAAAAAPPAQPAQPSTSNVGSVDPAAIGMIAAIKDELAVVKGNTEGLGKNVLDLSKQVEQLSTLHQKVDAAIWLLGQIAESVVGGEDANGFIAAAYKATGKG
jgi:hypothetical protein